MGENQILPKEASRPSKPDRSRLKKEKPLQARTLVFDSSPASSNGESISQSFSVSPSNPDLSASPGSSILSELTHSSEVKPDLLSFTDCGSKAAGDLTTFNSLEAEIVVGFLRKATSQVLNSPDTVDSESRKLLEALLEIVLDMLQKAPGEKDRISEQLQAKTRIVLIFIFLCLFVTVVTWIFSSGSQTSLGKPPPT
ncbi:hypothetical protein TIFTF001_021930 [Ficus carica]|uniref:Uncharacterized protein n=1 Tax=Ficus carica TaxID=3494 RepID=A0AA88AL76_FICCA|nr:hypothetical protein TIFTF001_021930 [Ficus carica]